MAQPKMTEPESFLEALRRDGVVRSSEARLTPLSGGVSCEIYLVEDGAERFVVKRALAKLKVKADWFADVNRNRHEWEYIRYVANFLPEAVPALRHYSAENNYFTMEHLDGSFANWKQLLLAGQASVEHARHAGNLLGQIHRHSADDAEAQRRFDTTQNFFQLRLDAYLLATGAKHPALRPYFEAEVVRLAATRECLVHGDFSPKNILISLESSAAVPAAGCGSVPLPGPDMGLDSRGETPPEPAGEDARATISCPTPGRMVILDCEVAWYGDPAFDAAFLLNHFFLKALLHAPRHAGMRPMVDAFWTAYQTARPSPEMEPRVGRLLPMLLLARVDGKSPAEYLDPTRQQVIREFVPPRLPMENASLPDLADSWFNRLNVLAK